MSAITSHQPNTQKQKPITLGEIQSRFEQEHQITNDPWGYAESGAEQIRYQKVVEIGKTYKPNPDRLLEIGCSFGLFTKFIVGWPKEALITDIAAKAIKAVEISFSNIDTSRTAFTFSNVSACNEFAPDNHFDVITLLDVLESVGDSYHIQVEMIANLRRMLKPDGILIITDYQNPKKFDGYVAKLEGWGMEVVNRQYLNDRLWFSMRSSLKGLAKSYLFKRLLASQSFAKRLAKLSAKRGTNGSKHMILVLRKAN